MQKTNIDWQKRRVALRIEKKDGQTSERTDWSRQEIKLAEGQPLGHIRVTHSWSRFPGDRLIDPMGSQAQCTVELSPQEIEVFLAESQWKGWSEKARVPTEGTANSFCFKILWCHSARILQTRSAGRSAFQCCHAPEKKVGTSLVAQAVFKRGSKFLHIPHKSLKPHRT